MITTDPNRSHETQSYSGLQEPLDNTPKNSSENASSISSSDSRIFSIIPSPITSLLRGTWVNFKWILSKIFSCFRSSKIDEEELSEDLNVEKKSSILLDHSSKVEPLAVYEIWEGLLSCLQDYFENQNKESFELLCRKWKRIYQSQSLELKKVFLEAYFYHEKPASMADEETIHSYIQTTLLDSFECDFAEWSIEDLEFYERVDLIWYSTDAFLYILSKLQTELSINDEATHFFKLAKIYQTFGENDSDFHAAWERVYDSFSQELKDLLYPALKAATNFESAYSQQSLDMMLKNSVSICESMKQIVMKSIKQQL